MKKALLPLACLLSCALFTGAHASTAIDIFFDDFNNDAIRTNADDLNNWTVSSGRVDVLGPGLFDDYPGNGAYIDLGGSNANAGRITTKTLFDLTIGATYQLTFDYGKSFASSVEERLLFGVADWTFEFRLPAAQIPELIPASYEFTVTQSTGRLFFENFGGDNAGPIIDNVGLRVLVPPAIIPLPASATLLFGGLVLLFGGQAALGGRVRRAALARLWPEAGR